MSDEIKFGTDGWRAVIGESFTFANVRRVASAIAVAARQAEAPPAVDRNAILVGFDRRFLSREFGATVAEVLAGSGYRVLLSDAPTPSQTVSFAVKKLGLLGGVVVTASHNPARYNGIKFKGWYGGSALPEMYRAIADKIDEKNERGGGSVTEADILDDYIDGLRTQIDVGKIKASKIAILHDPIHGVAATIPSHVLKMDYLGSSRIKSRESSVRVEALVDGIRGDVNPGFGGVNPEPIPENLTASRDVMATGAYDLAICNDGDADRLGILDEKGEFVSPHKIISLLALYLVREKKASGEIVKTFSTTRLLERIARSLGAQLHETAIGFKYVADLMLTRSILIGGEESGGIGFGSFLPERDGILSGLMVAECVAHYGKPLSQIVAAMEEEFGELHYDRRDVHRPVDQCERLLHRLEGEKAGLMFGSDFSSRETIDGVKLNYADGSWILFRKSGTEPMIRIYCESPDERKVPRMLDRAVAELDRVA
ncbi:MAG TPA: phosphoglucomutase/phosphomannomutase family protein [Thermoanaerobaculia bacterium]|nr:phosphoglucomutase/phosphomannomutase family protein [Thermoanaerobaculia bacterium]